MSKHLCDTCIHEFMTCGGEPVFGIDFYDGDVSYTAQADEVVMCDGYEGEQCQESPE